MNEKRNSLVEWSNVARQLLNELENIVQKVGLTWGTFVILHQLYGKEYLTPEQFSQFDQISRPAISRKLNMLQSQNFIQKLRNNEKDQRKVRIYITEMGKSNYLSAIENLSKLDKTIDKTNIAQLNSIVVKCRNLRV
ncbi:MarR family transcriptional regulator [Lactobacillus curvatus]|nr:MarR family transcriptional regulator [Latilactobacillus curvatus]MSE24071.1 MarR family transcriptional regulator [Latilactobacillus curvatus]